MDECIVKGCNNDDQCAHCHKCEEHHQEDLKGVEHSIK